MEGQLEGDKDGSAVLANPSGSDVALAVSLQREFEAYKLKSMAEIAQLKSTTEAYQAQEGTIQDLQYRLSVAGSVGGQGSADAGTEDASLIKLLRQALTNGHRDGSREREGQRFPPLRGDVPLFYGSATDENGRDAVNVHRFVLRVEVATDGPEWKEWQRISVARKNIKGTAALSLDTEEWRAITTWSEFKKKLVGTYTETTTITAFFDKMLKETRRKRETFKHFLVRMRAMAEDLGTDQQVDKNMKAFAVEKALKNNLPEKCAFFHQADRLLKDSVKAVKEFLSMVGAGVTIKRHCKGSCGQTAT